MGLYFCINVSFHSWSGVPDQLLNRFPAILMKKTILFLTLAAAAATPAFAQGGMSSTDYASGSSGNESRNTGVGIKGGYNVAYVKGSDTNLVPNANSLKAFNAGVYTQFGFNNFASLQIEVLYSRKGYHTDAGSVTTGSGATAVTTTYQGFDNRLDYIELPVMFVGNLTETLSFHLGPQVGVLTKVLRDGQNLDLKANGYNSLDYGVVGGAEARLGLGRLGVRYELSLADLYQSGASLKYGTTAITTNGNVRNQTLQVYLGIGYRK